MSSGSSTRREVIVTAAALAASAGAARAAPLCATPGADMTRLKEAMVQGRFVTYQPTALKAINGVLTQADDDSIRADLAVLRPSFDSLITYGAQNGAERVPDIAASLGYRAVVVGVWDFYNKTELDNALAAAARQPAIVAGLSLGNEMVLGKRGTWGDLAHALATVRARAPGVPLTVTEPFAQFLDDPDARAALTAMDFMLVNIHPIFEPWFRSAAAPNWADFVAKVADRLAAAFCGPVLVKETGVPSGPPQAGFSEAMQHDFWRALEARMPQTATSAFSYFSAFDAPWRPADFNPAQGAHPEEAYWGMFTEARVPKPVMADMAGLRSGSAP